MIPLIQNTPMGSSGDRAPSPHSHTAESPGLFFSTNNPVIVIIYSLIAIGILVLLYYIVRKIICQPVTLEVLNPNLYCSNSILNLGNNDSYQSLDSHNRKIGDTPCESNQGWYNHNKEFKKCFHIQCLPQCGQSHCNFQRSPRLDTHSDICEQQLISDQNTSDVSPEFDSYAYREVWKLSRPITKSVKSDDLDELPQIRDKNSPEIVFLDRDGCTTTPSDYHNMENDPFSVGVDLTRQNSKRQSSKRTKR
jgi:hypothetical protein